MDMKNASKEEERFVIELKALMDKFRVGIFDVSDIHQERDFVFMGDKISIRVEDLYYKLSF